MDHLLHISASPRGSHSESLALAEEFVSELLDRMPELRVETWDLWDGTLPAFGRDATGAKMAVFAGQTPAGAQAEAWNAAREAFERFDVADTYLFSVPMWNHGVPYILKQFIDVVSQPGMVFGFDPVEGYSGLLRGKRAFVVYTGAVYGAGRPPSFGFDFQKPYFEGWLRWAGIDDIVSVEFRPNLATGRAAELREQARAQVREAAAALGRRTAA
jgi:FMN-dependent NADH-azoreductase